MKDFTYKRHYIMLERQLHNGSVIATAIPEGGGETIRQVLYGYNQTEATRLIKQLVSERGA